MKAPKRIGRPLAWESPDDLLDWFLDYINECIKLEKIPSMAGFRANKFIPASTLFEYERRDEFSKVFIIMRDILEDSTLNNAKIDSATRKLVLQSKFDYTEKKEIKSTNTSSLELVNLSNEEINDKITKLLEKQG